MSENEVKQIEKIEAHQEDLLSIYTEVFRALSDIDQSQYDAEDLRELEALEPPDEIEPAKAIAILKAILGSTPDDKIQLETFYGVPIEGASSVGSFIHHQLEPIDIDYFDFYPYLRTKGWLKTP